jgi:hypothetical protein
MSALRARVVEATHVETTYEVYAPGKRQNELLSILTDRRLVRGPALATLLILILANVLLNLDRGSLVDERAANLLINGADVAGAPVAEPVVADGAPTRYDHSVGENLEAYWSAIPDARQEPLVILAGMSQNYAINDGQPGDETLTDWTDDFLAPKGARAFGLSAPNLSTEEALFLLLATVTDPRTHPNTFIYGVCFDKLRNTDLRPGYRRVLLERPELAAAWAQAAERLRPTHPLAADEMLAALAGPAPDAVAQKSISDNVESTLRDGFATFVPIVKLRTELNAHFQQQLFLARNAVLNIKPTSKRPMIQSRYRANLDLLSAIADVAPENNVQLMLYINPLNPVADNPYIPEEYSAFKDWLTQFSASRSIPFANLENVVSADAWGEFMGGPDFKHFREEGHKITAEAIVASFGALIPHQS